MKINHLATLNSSNILTASGDERLQWRSTYINAICNGMIDEGPTIQNTQARLFLNQLEIFSKMLSLFYMFLFSCLIPLFRIYCKFPLCTIQALVFGSFYSVSWIQLNGINTVVVPFTNQCCLDFQTVNIQ
jgi:hypothetical protein